ncbi:hypothetical protein KSZ_68580 [Dictyobacter formicarum]|uniref:Rv2525c-like glycoside hydrolase-like domain-containing protein n=2 Tax=Dictyobacter formicarum TaxID=2778368 RepID=A0ABQ3VSJ7_9CHLR|nr:hypothetical protein KSZ_68580 [Dictyobacter formicarum]
MYLGQQGPDALCPAHAIGKGEALQIEPLATANPATISSATLATTVADVPAKVNPSTRLNHTFIVVLANAGVVIHVSYKQAPNQARQILGTLQVSAQSSSTPVPSTSTSTTTTQKGSHVQPHVVNPPNEYSGVYQGQGFDTCAAPSTGAMSAWLSSPYRAIGIYIGGANRACGDGNLSSSWVDTVTSNGWNLMPLYVGLQAPCTSFATIDPNQAAAQGSQAADDAVNLARGFSLPTGTLITFDMENYSRGGSCSQTVMTFLSAWTQELHARNYLSGVYSSVSSGISDLISYAGSIQEPDTIYFARWDGAATTSDSAIPSQDWSHHQRIKQYEGGHNETYNGVTINIDTDQFDATLYNRAGSSTHHMPGFSQFGTDRYQLHTDGSIWLYNGSPSSWQQLDNNPLTVAITADGNGGLYQLHSDGEIWKYVGPPMSGNCFCGWQRLDNNPATTAIAVDGKGQLYQLHNDGTVWLYQGPPMTGWQELDKWSGNVELATDGLGGLYLLHSDGSIYKYQGTPYSWQQLDNNPATIDIGADGKGNLYQLHNDGTLWLYQGTPMTGWQELDNWSGNIAFAADNVGNLYVLHSDGSIWKYQSTPMTNWLEVDNNPAAVAIAADGNGDLYQLHNDGSIWLYQGPPITGWQNIDNYWQTTALSGAY